MKFLVIGSDGQLGQDILKILKENNEDYYAATLEDADITKSEEIKKLLDKEKPDGVVNCAAFHDVGKCEENSEIAMEVNATAVANLAKISNEKGIKFMTVSSDYVFDGTKEEGYIEEDTLNPLMEYGRSKLAGEILALAYNKKTFVVRTQSLYGIAGPKEKGLNFVDLMLKLSKEKDELQVDQCKMAPTWTYALAKNMYKLIKTEHYGLYHISCNKPTTWYEFAKKIMELTNNPIKVTPVGNDFFPRNFKRPEKTYLINKKLKNLNLDLMPDTEEALKEYLKLKGLIK
jgi:dTDP-4-dehydrorhamnose reductase